MKYKDFCRIEKIVSQHMWRYSFSFTVKSEVISMFMLVIVEPCLTTTLLNLYSQLVITAIFPWLEQKLLLLINLINIITPFTRPDFSGPMVAR